MLWIFQVFALSAGLHGFKFGLQIRSYLLIILKPTSTTFNSRDAVGCETKHKYTV